MHLTPEFLGQKWGPNTVQDYLEAITVAASVFIVLLLIKSVALGRILQRVHFKDKATENFVRGLFDKLRPTTFFLVGLYFGAHSIEMRPVVERAVHGVILFGITIYFIRIMDHVIRYAIPRAIYNKRQHTPEAENSLSHLITLVRIFVWIGAILFYFSNLGFNVTSAIAGLGIGGIAVALAAQNILGDVFSSFVILIGKPFEIGDFITKGDDKGTIEYIGLKTTRLRSVDGETIIVPNSELTKSVVRNYRALPQKRVVLNLRIGYNTSKEKLELIPGIGKQTVESIANTRFSHCGFSNIIDFAFVYEFGFFVLSPHGTQVVQTQNEVLLKLVQNLESSGIGLVFNAPEHLRGPTA